MKEKIYKIISKFSSNSSHASIRIIKGIVWNFLGLVFNKGFTMLASILVARYLGTMAFGQYGMINSTIMTFATLAGLGLGITATKYVAEYRESDKEKVGRILGLTNIFGIISGSIMATAVFFGSEWLSINQLQSIEMAPYLKITAILLLFNTYNGIQRSTLSGLEKFSILAKIDAIIGFFSFILTLCGTYYFGLSGLLVVNVIIAFLNLVMCSWSLKSALNEFNIKVRYLDFYKEIKAFIQVSLPSLVQNIMIGPIQWFSNTLFITIPNGYSALGIFNAAFQWKIFLQMLPSIFNLALVPILLSSKNKSSEKLEKINMLLSWAAVVFIALPIINLPDLISFFYGKQYISYNYHAAIVFAALTSIMLAYKEGMARAILRENKMWRGVADNLLWAITLIISVILFRDNGAMGMAFSYFLSYFISAIVFIPYNIYKKTIDKNAIFSKKVLFIWMVIFVETLFTLLNFPFVFRLCVAIINYTLILVYLLFILRKRKRTNA